MHVIYYSDKIIVIWESETKTSFRRYTRKLELFRLRYEISEKLKPFPACYFMKGTQHGPLYSVDVDQDIPMQ